MSYPCSLKTKFSKQRSTKKIIFINKHNYFKHNYLDSQVNIQKVYAKL